MKIIILDADTIINGVPRSRGEVVSVPDSYAEDVRRVVAEHVDLRNSERVAAFRERVKDRKFNERFKEGLEKLQAILQADYRQFWNALQQRQEVQDAIVAEMRDNPELLQRALDDPQWFVDIVTARFGGKNAK